MLSDKCENLENAISLLFPSEFLSTSRLDAARAHCRLRVEMRASRMPSLAHILVGQQQDDPYTAGQQDPYALDYWSPRGRSGSEGSPLGDGDGPGGRAGPTWESRAGESAPPHAFQQQFPVRMAGGETRTAPSAQPDPRQPLRERLSRESLAGVWGYGGERWEAEGAARDEKVLAQEVQRGLGMLTRHLDAERTERRSRGVKLGEWRDNLLQSWGTWGNRDEEMLQLCSEVLEEVEGFASELAARKDEILSELQARARARAQHNVLIAAAGSDSVWPVPTARSRDRRSWGAASASSAASLDGSLRGGAWAKGSLDAWRRSGLGEAEVNGGASGAGLVGTVSPLSSDDSSEHDPPRHARPGSARAEEAPVDLVMAAPRPCRPRPRPCSPRPWLLVTRVFERLLPQPPMRCFRYCPFPCVTTAAARQALDVPPQSLAAPRALASFRHALALDVVVVLSDAGLQARPRPLLREESSVIPHRSFPSRPTFLSRTCRVLN